MNMNLNVFNEFELDSNIFNSNPIPICYDALMPMNQFIKPIYKSRFTCGNWQEISCLVQILEGRDLKLLQKVKTVDAIMQT